MTEQNIVTDKRLFYKINIAHRILLKFIDREVMDILGVPVIQTAALFYLNHNDGSLLKDLSKILFQNKSATTTLVERMEKNRLIVKKKSQTDGRAYHLFLTEKGREIVTAAHPIVKEYNNKLVENFTESEIKTIHRFLDKIIGRYS